jgi:hypothetical protein
MKRRADHPGRPEPHDWHSSASGAWHAWCADCGKEIVLVTVVVRREPAQHWRHVR